MSKLYRHNLFGYVPFQPLSVRLLTMVSSRGRRNKCTYNSPAAAPLLQQPHPQQRQQGEEEEEEQQLRQQQSSLLGKTITELDADEVKSGCSTLTASTISAIPPSDDLPPPSSTWSSNLYYLQADDDDSFDGSLVDKPPSGSNTGKRYIPPLRFASFYGNTAGCFMNVVDTSSPVEPQSWKERCSTFGCDELAFERFVDDTNRKCDCNNGNDLVIDVGNEEVIDVDGKRQKRRQNHLDEDDYDEFQMRSRFCGLIKLDHLFDMLVK